VSTNEPVSLERTLRGGAVVLFGLAYMAPLIVLGTFGVLAQTTNGAVPSAYLVALVGMVFTALSYGRMAAVFPVAGSSYTYTRRTIDSRVGFLVGWATLLDYFFLPMVIWLIGASYLSAQFPGIPGWTWILGFIVLTTAINVVGIQVAANANLFLMIFQILVLVVFVLLSIRHVFGTAGASGLVSGRPFTGVEPSLPGISAGAAVAAYSFLGFDAVTTLTEETVNPVRTIPRAILLTTLLGGGIFILVSYTTQLVHPGGEFRDVDTASFEIAKVIGGDLFASVFVAGLVVTQFAAGIAAQASASRLLFAMGRDSVFPKKIFGFVHPRFHTPAVNILLTGVVGFSALGLDVETSTSFINFGAFTAFTFVNLSLIAHILRERKRHDRKTGVFGLLAPTIGAGVDLWLLTSLDTRALVIGLSWLAIGIAYLMYLTRFFRVPAPEMLESKSH
jgi:amino acid transporter